MDHLQRFIEKAAQIYGDLYDYTQFVWTGAQSKGIIVCKQHGPFTKTPEHHVGRHQGCKTCSDLKKAAARTFTKEQFVIKAMMVHGDAYGYDEFDYRGSTVAGKILCRLHARVFKQTPSHHLSGHSSCDECIKMKSQQTSLMRYGAAHHTQTDEYNQKVKRTSMDRFGVEHHSKVADFRETMRQTSLTRYGVEFPSQLPTFQEQVRKTSIEKYGVNHMLSAPAVRNKIQKTVKTRYGVENVIQAHIAPESLDILNDRDQLIELLEVYSVKELARCVLGVSECTLGRYCHQHFIDLPSSTYEAAIATFLRSNGIDMHLHDRSIIAPLEIDFLLHDHKVGIEFDGIYYHGEQIIADTNYHLKKLQRMHDAGYRLITIFEDEWLHHRSVVETRLLHFLGKSLRGRGARELSIRTVRAADANNFLNVYHIQGAGPNGYVRYGAYNDDTLVAIMTFSRPRVALGRRTGGDELLRFATDGKTYPGVASRLFRTFLRDHQPSTVISYADRRWSDGHLYEQLGFHLTHQTQPNYWYTDRNKIIREHRFKYRKDRIKHLVEDGENKTERQIMQELGRDRIWDCGSLKYEWIA